MIKAETSFTFHPVGQGLFYSGIIKFDVNNPRYKKEFKFIYDCGSESQKKIEYEIKRFGNRYSDKNIDMLVISHFHKDHINGLGYLLSNFHIKKVFLPYITDIERLIIAAKNLDAGSSYFSFLADPYNYLKEKGVEEIIVINGGEVDEGGGEMEHIYPELSPEISIINKLNDDKNIKDDNKQVIYKTHNGYVYLSGLWCFKFYVKEIDKEKEEEFKSCIEKCPEIYNKITSGRVKEIIFEPNLRNKLKECYRTISTNLNNTSMMMMHIPINEEKIHNKLSLYYWKFLYDLCPSCLIRYPEMRGCFSFYARRYPHMNYCFYCCKRIRDIYRVFGHSLTGDINMKDKTNYSLIQEHFDYFKKKICVNQIPHHGARENWNKSFLYDFLPIFNIASAGKENKYGHPDLDVFEDIYRGIFIPIHVNEDNWFTYKANIEW